MELVDASLQMWLTFGVIIVAVMLYTDDRIPLEISSIATVAVLLLLFEILPVRDEYGDDILTPRDILKGFADPALITILALLVVGQGLDMTQAQRNQQKADKTSKICPVGCARGRECLSV